METFSIRLSHSLANKSDTCARSEAVKLLSNEEQNFVRKIGADLKSCFCKQQRSAAPSAAPRPSAVTSGSQFTASGDVDVL